MEAPQGEDFGLPTEIVWPQGVSERTEAIIKSAPKRKQIPEIILGIMEQEKDYLNIVLPEALIDKPVDELLAYNNVIERLKRAFKVPDRHPGRIRISAHSTIPQGIKKQLSGGINFRDTYTAQVQHDRTLLKRDSTGFSLVDSFLKEAAQQAGGFEGINQGTFRAVSRYKELHSFAKRVR